MKKTNRKQIKRGPRKPEKKRKPYAPPKILSHEQLEAFAALCRPIPPAKATPYLCPQGPISS